VEKLACPSSCIYEPELAHPAGVGTGSVGQNSSKVEIHHCSFATMSIQYFLVATVALLAAVPAASASNSAEHVKRSLADIEKVYDYIIVGGGTSGLVVANRLTENANSMATLVYSASAEVREKLLTGCQQRFWLSSMETSTQAGRRTRRASEGTSVARTSCLSHLSGKKDWPTPPRVLRLAPPWAVARR
jgi:hypothetical protein